MTKRGSSAGSRKKRPSRCQSTSRRGNCCLRWRSKGSKVDGLKNSMSKISIVELEVFYCVGVTEEERAEPQRLLVTVDMNVDFSSASVSDRIEKTINYQEVAEELLKYGHGRSWKLLEKLVANIADLI